jgi:hypothetical protein
MSRDRNMLMVIADGEPALIVRPTEDYALHARAVMDFSTGGRTSADQTLSGILCEGSVSLDCSTRRGTGRRT